MKSFTILKLSILIGLCMILGSCQNTGQDFTGSYINHNFDYEPFLTEIPYSSDTLILKKDSTFTSGYYGKGTYQIKNNSLTLNYKYEMGNASYEAPIEKDELGDIRIILFRDQNHYYQKINLNLSL